MHRPSMPRSRLIATAAALALSAARASAVPGDPTDGQNPLDDLVRPLAELNLRPDFELTRDQKAKVQAVRQAYAARLDRWRADHAAEFQRQAQAWEALHNGRGRPAGGPPGGPPGGPGRPTGQWLTLREDRQKLMVSSPDPADALIEIEAALSPDQRRLLDAATINHDADVAGTGGPAAFAADVLPLPADGVPKLPGFYKLKVTADVPTDGGGQRHIRMTYILFLPHDYDAAKARTRRWSSCTARARWGRMVPASSPAASAPRPSCGAGPGRRSPGTSRWSWSAPSAPRGASGGTKRPSSGRPSRSWTTPRRRCGSTPTGSTPPA